jgi:hypothetical protein
VRKATLTILAAVTGLGLWAGAENNPVARLPGMSPAPKSTRLAPPSSFPREIITDVMNVPNPVDTRRAGMEGQTQISYRLVGDYPVSVTMYDLVGHRVREWTFRAGDNGARTGLNAFLWDGTNEAGQKVSKGGYLAQIEIVTPETVVTALRKIAVIH